MGATVSPRCYTDFILAAVVAIAFFMPPMTTHAANDQTLSKEDKACLECHAKPELEMTLADGAKLSLFIPARAFAESTHNSSGCDGCHSDIDLKTHGTQKKNINSKREQSLAMMETCRDCHKKTVKQYEDSVHSALVQEGSKKAPLCSDCHNPHATRSAKDAGGHAEPIACQKCHEAITKAYAESVHGQAGDEALGYAGASLREMTRVAGANPAVWADIFVENGDLIADALAAHGGSARRGRARVTRARPRILRTVDRRGSANAQPHARVRLPHGGAHAEPHPRADPRPARCARPHHADARRRGHQYRGTSSCATSRRSTARSSSS